MRRIVSALVAYFLVGVASAQTAAVDPIPDVLEQWRGWVMHDLEYRACPFLVGQDPSDESAYVCAWPGRLQIHADAGGATFSLRWRVDAPSWIALPGDADAWPQDVTANGKPATVLLHDDAPMIWASPGDYDLRGRMLWSQRPQQLALPSSVGLVDLSVDGKAVSPIERSDDQLTLGRGEVAEPEADTIELRVFRKLVDTVPARLETRIHLDVSGQAREESFGPVLPDGFVPLALNGPLATRLDADGKLRVQVQPGSWDLTLHARATAPVAKVIAATAPEPWPAQEIWSFAAVNGLRVASATADLPIDPAQAGVPDDWRALPAFALQAGGVLTIEERSRGLSGEDANRLTLNREAWLDFSGKGMYAKDRIVGRMHRDWRLDVVPPYALERADADGEGLLVTKTTKGLTGVELRNPNVDLAAGVRIADVPGRFPVAGWQQSFDSVSMTLHLPYSYRLLAAPGADTANGSWIARWTLLDVFLTAMVGLLAWRLLGPAGGIGVLAYVVLGYHEPGSPLWTLLFSLALALLLRALPTGRLRTVMHWTGRVVVLLLVLLTLPFLARQVRYALYPQLETASMSTPFGAFDDMTLGGAIMEKNVAMNEPVQAVEEMAPPPAPAAPPAPAPKPAEADQEQRMESIVVTGSRVKRVDVQSASSVAPLTRSSIDKYAGKQNLQRYAQNTVIQAGRGEPGWQFGTTNYLSWSGPVLADQSVRLLISPPWLTRLLRVLMLAALAWSIAALLRRLFGAPTRAPSAASTAAAMLFGVAAVIAFPTVNAQGLPDTVLLDTLRERLTEAPECAPDCATAARAQVRAAGDRIELALELHVGERVAIPLPDDTEALALESVRVGNETAEALARRDGALWLALPRGVHRVAMQWRVLGADHLSLKFPLHPQRVDLALDGWQAGGVGDDRLLGDTLSLARERSESSAEGEGARGSAQQFPPFVEVERRVMLDLEWRVESVARRQAPERGGFAVSVPLLAGEQVLSSGVKVQEAAVVLPFGADQSEVAWNSRLARSEAMTITLTAPPLADRAEVWKVVLSPTWHAEFAGVPEVASSDGGNYWTHEFHPLPGETLTIALQRPEAVVGRSLAIDSVGLTSAISRRAVDTTLDLGLRSTQGGEHVITLPPAAEVLGVSKNGQSLNLRPREQKLSLPLTPGAQRFQLRLRQTQEIGVVARTAAIDVGAAAANVSLALDLPENRWVLFTFGPSVGPAVLYWGELVVMILLAVGLARMRRTPLKVHHWLLLGFGFSTASWFALIVVVAWLLALDWRDRNVDGPAARFNLVQIGLALLTVIAMFCIVGAVYRGLLGEPDMSVTGNGSWAHALRWFADQSEGVLPQAGAITLPLWLHKIAILAWALWLAMALIGWLRWGYVAWSRGGYWKRTPRAPRNAPIGDLPEPPPMQ